MTVVLRECWDLPYRFLYMDSESARKIEFYRQIKIGFSAVYDKGLLSLCQVVHICPGAFSKGATRKLMVSITYNTILQCSKTPYS